jgi:hypothetical protein
LTAEGRALDGESTYAVDGAIETLIGEPSPEPGTDAKSALESLTARLEAALEA